jgi:hypothetical protein
MRLMGTKVTDSGVPVIMVWPTGVIGVVGWAG